MLLTFLANAPLLSGGLPLTKSRSRPASTIKEDQAAIDALFQEGHVVYMGPNYNANFKHIPTSNSQMNVCDLTFPLGARLSICPTKFAQSQSMPPHRFAPVVPEGLSLQITSALILIFGCATLWAFLQANKKTTHKVSRREDSVRSEDIVGKLGNLDHAPARRRVRAAFQKAQQSLDHPLFRESLDGLKAEEYYVENSRGIEIFSRSWRPTREKVKALVFICHGYGDTCTFFFEGVGRILAKSGYVVFGMDYSGCGLSSGLHGFIPDFNKLVDDVIENYSKIKAQPEFHKLPCFLFGESMGGAVALKAHLRQPNAWNGAVLVAPMCKMSPEMYPPWLLIQILKGLCYLFPRAKLVPDKNLADLAFKDVTKRKQVLVSKYTRMYVKIISGLVLYTKYGPVGAFCLSFQTAYNVTGYKDPPRLRTALELLRTTDDISDQLNKICLPLLILHGACDVIIDCSVSKALYEQSRSTDKTLHIYENAWHNVLEGEPDEVIFQVLSDIKSWLFSHST